MNRKAIVPGFIFGVVLALALTSVAAMSGPIEDGLDAAKRGDYATALRLWRPLAEEGDAFAQYNLGLIYAAGLGVPRDDVRAHMWFSLAAPHFSSGAGHDAVVNNRGVVAKRMSPAQIAEARKLAREWRPK